MARGIKWRLQFKSLQNIGCLVNIYEDNYTSSADTTKTGANVPFTCENGVRALMGAAVPFEYEEEDSDDLLELIRYRTGYIRVIEVTYDELADLIPTTLTAHYVEAFYGSELVFTGYMQMQTFQQPWVAVPRELEFPIVSPLGLAESIAFPYPDYGPYQVADPIVTVGRLLQVAAGQLDENYTEVAYPVDSEAYGDAALYPWNRKISVMVATPLNGDFKPTSNETELYQPSKVYSYLHGICATMGWMLHEWPGRLFFSNTRCTSCGLLPLSSAAAGTDTGWTRVPGNAGIGNFFVNADDDASISTILPLNKLTLNYEGERNVLHSVPTKYATGMGHIQKFYDGSGKWGVYNFLKWQLPTVRSDFPILDDNVMTGTFVAFVIYGAADTDTYSVSPSKFWIAKPGTLSNVFKLLLAWRTYEFSEFGDFLLKIQFEVGEDINNFEPTGWGSNFNVYIRIYNHANGKYLNIHKYDVMQTWWTDNDDYAAFAVLSDTGKIAPDTDYEHADNDGCIFYLPPGLKDLDVQMAVSANSNIDPDWLLKFVNFSISRATEFAADDTDWDEYINSEKTTLVGNDKGDEDGSLTLEVNNNYPNSHYFEQLTPGGESMATKYAHVFSPTSILKQRMMRKNASGWTFAWYAGQYGYWRSENPVNPWYWHILAHSFNLRDDEVGLTLITPNVSYVYTQAYQVAALLDNVQNTFPSTVVEHASVQWSVVAEDGYAVDYVKVMMGGVDITSTAWSSSTGKITITDVTGDVEITASAVAVTYTVSNDLTNVTNSNSATTATGGSRYQATLTAAAHSTMDSVTVEMGGTDITSRVYNSSTGAIDIPVVTGNIEITASAVASEVMLTQTLTHVTSSAQDGYVPIGSALTVTYSEDSGYHIDSSQTKVYMGGVDVTSSVIGQSSMGIVMYISNVTGPVVVTVVAEQVLPYDAVVEYLRSNGVDGRAYIDTGITVSNNVTVIINSYVFSGNNAFIFGARMAYNNSQMTLMVDFGNNRTTWGFGNVSKNLSNNPSSGSYVLDNTGNSRIMKVNGTSITANTAKFSNSNNIYLFCINNNGNPAQAQTGADLEISSAKIYVSGTLMRDYIAVRKDGVGYLYDKVTETLFGNAYDRGSFTYGNDVNT